MNLRRQSTSAGTERKAYYTKDSNSNQSSTGTLIVVNKGTSKDATVEQDPDILRLKVRFYYHLFLHGMVAQSGRLNDQQVCRWIIKLMLV